MVVKVLCTWNKELYRRIFPSVKEEDCNEDRKISEDVSEERKRNPLPPGIGGKCFSVVEVS